MNKDTCTYECMHGCDCGGGLVLVDSRPDYHTHPMVPTRLTVEVVTDEDEQAEVTGVLYEEAQPFGLHLIRPDVAAQIEQAVVDILAEHGLEAAVTVH